MSKHIDNLERLKTKMAALYGEDDDLVLQFQHEIDLLKVKKEKRKNSPTASGEVTKQLAHDAQQPYSH